MLRYVLLIAWFALRVEDVVMVRLCASVLLLGLLVPLSRAGEAEDQVVKRIEALGGGVKRATAVPGKPIVAVLLFNTQATDADLKMLAALKHVLKLDLYRTRVSDAGLKELKPLPQLRELDLQGTAVTDAGLKELAALKQLQKLNLRLTRVTAAGVAELHKALPTCQISHGDGGEGQAVAAINDRSKDDLKKLQGKWQVVTAFQDGALERFKGKEFWIFEKNQLTIADQKFLFTLDATKKPKAMDARGVGDNKTIKAIYDMDADGKSLLFICIDTKDKGRPGDFESKAGSGRRLVNLTRPKK